MSIDDRLARFLAGADRTFRWNDGETRDSYEAVETTRDGLRWYHWSHRAEDGGPSDEALQCYDDFERDGPLREMPAPLLAELRAHLARRGTSKAEN